VQAVLQMIPIGTATSACRCLPLSHSYERMMDYTLFQAGVIINYAESFGHRRREPGGSEADGGVVDTTALTKRCTRGCSRTRCRECDQARDILLAKRTGEQWATLSLAGLQIPGGLRFKKKIGRPVGLREATGPHRGRIRFLRLGRRAVVADIAKFFYSAGLPVIEGYGLTETSRSSR